MQAFHREVGTALKDLCRKAFFFVIFVRFGVKN